MDFDDPNLKIPWDACSEQPHFIRHKRSLWRRLRHGLLDYVKVGLTCLGYLPLVVYHHVRIARGLHPASWRVRSNDPRDFMGLAVALQSCEPDHLAVEINAVGVRHILLRIPVWETDQLDKYRRFIEAIPDTEIVVCIMQDRAHVVDLERWRASLGAIVGACWPRVRTFQVGQGVNRSKWGIFSFGEYLALAAEAEKVRHSHPGLELVGPSILDFEIMPLLRGLVHGYDVRWDAVGCALYVDRRGSPRNRQLLLFDLKQKVNLFAACIACSRKSAKRFWITEFNWPLENQGAYSPVRRDICVSEDDAARFLREYYEDAWDAKLVERAYWWQLVAKGFGLIGVEDDGSLRKRAAYHEFKDLLDGGLADRKTGDVTNA